MLLITNECIAVASCFVFLETLLCNASLCIISEVFQGYIIMYVRNSKERSRCEGFLLQAF